MSDARARRSWYLWLLAVVALAALWFCTLGMVMAGSFAVATSVGSEVAHWRFVGGVYEVLWLVAALTLVGALGTLLWRRLRRRAGAGAHAS